MLPRQAGRQAVCITNWLFSCENVKLEEGAPVLLDTHISHPGACKIEISVLASHESPSPTWNPIAQ